MKYLYLSLFFLWTTSTYGNFQGPNPAPIAAYFGQTAPRGSETFTTFFMTIYDVTLWTQHPQWDFNQISAIHLQYKRNITKDKLLHYSMKAMEHIITDKKDLKKYEKILEPYVSPVQEGDTFTFIYLPHQGIEFYNNRQKLGTCTDMGFAQTFMNIWLSPKTEYPAVREALLGTC